MQDLRSQSQSSPPAHSRLRGPLSDPQPHQSTISPVRMDSALLSSPFLSLNSMVQCYARHWGHRSPDLIPILKLYKMMGASHSDSIRCDGAKGSRGLGGYEEAPFQPEGIRGGFQETEITKMRGIKPDFKKRC